MRRLNENVRIKYKNTVCDSELRILPFKGAKHEVRRQPIVIVSFIIILLPRLIYTA